MALQLIDGKELSKTVLQQTQRLLQQSSRKPGLVSVVIGNDKLSHFFSDLKGKTAQKAGLTFQKVSYPDNFDPERILTHIQQLNSQHTIHGIVVQLPLPSSYKRHVILKSVHPYKDVDCLHPKNMGLMLEGNPVFLPPVVLAVIDAINATKKYPIKSIEYLNQEYTVPDLSGVPVTLIGGGILVGQPLATYLPFLGATVTLVNEYSTNTDFYLRNAQIIVTGTNASDVLEPTAVSPGTVILPVADDVIIEKFSTYDVFMTPNPGGIGPLTIAHLIRNTALSCEVLH
ncbi:bifunctional 5,10-methylenetetrahydrofolate dehydrogenase/5,10-methenyltetrahydrofolate cyclohydrolase [candidate division WWE3 bacterium]|nr:bifunctional 5,10-methylenetetrahydrofolate dehydrogenase/5,10-methenyltetrahydrofolate cyclohydrolase [candidate division WWE3 bacterium]